MSTATLERSVREICEVAEIPDVPDGYELVDGELTEIAPMSFYAVEVANVVADAIRLHEPSMRRGRLRMGDQCYFVPTPEDLTKVRKPDLVYVTFETWPVGMPLPFYGNAIALVPELVVEVVSPTDDADDVISKARQYLKAGVQSVWVIYPGAREIHCFHANTLRVFTDESTLEGDPVLPGFTLPVASIFPVVESTKGSG
jgi:Uma2 family endonuclease